MVNNKEQRTQHRHTSSHRLRTEIGRQETLGNTNQVRSGRLTDPPPQVRQLGGEEKEPQAIARGKRNHDVLDDFSSDIGTGPQSSDSEDT
jgi:hypothetical protein